MKILYLKGYKWLLSMNQRVRNGFFGYRRYQALAKLIKPFLKNIKVKGRQCPHQKELCSWASVRFQYQSSIINVDTDALPTYPISIKANYWKRVLINKLQNSFQLKLTI